MTLAVKVALNPSTINQPCNRKSSYILINCLPNDKVLDLSNLKGFADDKRKMTQKLKFVLERVKYIVGKGENAGYQDFLLFPQCFQKPFYTGSLKVDSSLILGVLWSMLSHYP